MSRAIKFKLAGELDGSPFAKWNLRRNPFGELTRAERAEVAIVDALEEWLGWLCKANHALQFVGSCGFGKTTCLLAIERALGNATYIYYPEDGPRPPLPLERPLIVDEAQRMGFWQQRNLMTGSGPVVVSTHVDLSRKLRRAGFEVFTVNAEAPKSAALILRILNRRIESSRLDEQRSLPFVDIAFAEKLLAKFGSNVRSIEHYLYACFQQSISEHAPWPPVI
jgi:hypothetical protein